MTFDDDVLAFAQALTALMPNTRHWTDNPAAVIVAARLSIRLKDGEETTSSLTQAWVKALDLDKRVAALEAQRSGWCSIGDLELQPQKAGVYEFKKGDSPDSVYGIYSPSHGWEFVSATGQSLRNHILGTTTLGFLARRKISQFRRLGP